MPLQGVALNNNSFQFFMQKMISGHYISSYIWHCFSLPFFLAVSKCNGPFPMVDMPKKSEISFPLECDCELSTQFATVILFLYLSRKWFQDLSTGWLCCDPGPMFKPEHYSLGEWVPKGVRTLNIILFNLFILLSLL